MEIRYYVCGLGYDENLEAIDYEVDFDSFDTYEEAYELFVKLQCRSAESFFVNASKVYEIDLRVEECEETEDEIECVNVRNEWGIINPNFKTGVDIKKIAYEKYKLDWLLKHGYTLVDLVSELDKMQEENPDDSVSQLFVDWEYGFGFGSEVWACYQEFLENEYQNIFYMLQLLNWDESEEYKKDIKFEEEN